MNVCHVVGAVTHRTPSTWCDSGLRETGRPLHHTSPTTLHTRAEKRRIFELIFTFKNLVLEVRLWQMAWRMGRICGFWGADAPLLGDNSCSCDAQTTHPRSANMRVLRQNEATCVVFRRVWGEEKMTRKTYVAALQAVGKITEN